MTASLNVSEVKLYLVLEGSEEMDGLNVGTKVIDGLKESDGGTDGAKVIEGEIEGFKEDDGLAEG